MYAHHSSRLAVDQPVCDRRGRIRHLPRRSGKKTAGDALRRKVRGTDLQHQRQPLQIATESINVGDELNLILHNRALLASEAHYDRGETSLAQTTILKGPRLRRQAYCQ